MGAAATFGYCLGPHFHAACKRKQQLLWGSDTLPGPGPHGTACAGTSPSHWFSVLCASSLGGRLQAVDLRSCCSEKFFSRPGFVHLTEQGAAPATAGAKHDITGHWTRQPIYFATCSSCRRDGRCDTNRLDSSNFRWFTQVSFLCYTKTSRWPHVVLWHSSTVSELIVPVRETCIFAAAPA